MLKKYFIVVFLLIQNLFFGQTEYLRGEILADSLQGYAINIVNFTQKLGTTNDESGYFTIPAAINDSIIFSSVQYEIKTIVINEEHLNGIQKFYLYPIIEQLPEVNISNITLSGDIEKDSKNVEIKPFVNNQNLGLPYKDIEQPTQEERRLYTAMSSSGFVSVDYIINLISGKIKKLKRNKRISDYEETVKKGTEAFVERFFVEDLEIPEDLIEDFIYFSSEDEKFKALLQLSSKLDLLEFLQTKAAEYKKHKRF